MICSKCGQPLEPGATFCGNCGQPVQQAQPVQPQPQQIQVQQPPTQVIQPDSYVSPPSPVQPMQQSAVVMQQVLANQPTNTPPINFNYPSYATAGGRAIPAYAEQPLVSKGAEIRSIIGLIAGAVGIPASIIPLAGLALGIIGLVLSTTARSKYKHLINLLAIIFSAVAIVTALGVWAYLVERSTNASSNNAVSTTDLQSISTPCYSVQIPKGLNSYTPQGCNFNSASTTEEFTVDAANPGTVTTANFDANAKTILNQGATAGGATLISENLGTFAGSPAEIGIFSQGTDQYLIMAVVLHNEPQDSLFVIGREVLSASNNKPTFESLESTWVWK